MSFTAYFDDRIMLASYLMLQGEVIPRAVLTVYKGRNGNDDDDIEGDKAKYIKAKARDPLIQVAMTDCQFTSVSTGGSGGEDRLTVNMSLSFKSFGYIVQQYPADSKKEYNDFFPRPFAIGFNYSKLKDPNFREWGKINTWSSKTHYQFPPEFRKIVTTILLVHQRNDPGNYLQFIPAAVLDIIFSHLAVYYIPQSPFSESQYPGFVERHTEEVEGIAMEI